MLGCGVGVGDGGVPATSTVAEPVADPAPISPSRSQVTVADNVAVSPPRALPGTRAEAARLVAWPACSRPTVQVWVPAPLPHDVKPAAGKDGDRDETIEIRTVTWSSTLDGEMRMPKEAACPGATVPADCTLTHRLWHWASGVRPATRCAWASVAAAVPAPSTLIPASTASTDRGAARCGA